MRLDVPSNVGYLNRRAVLAGIAFFVAVFSLIVLTVHTEESEVDEESGQEIIERDLFLSMKRAGGPGHSIPTDAYANAVRERLQLEKSSELTLSPNATSWTSANPNGMFYARTNANYIAGRTNSIAFHPTNANIIYLGAAGGGVWKTINGGTTWQALTDNLTSIACGAVAIDPSNPSTIYFGTGELNYSLDSYYGDGIYKSTDEGSSWIKIATTAVGSRFSQITVDPANSDIVYAAGSLGVYKSTNVGGGWTSTGSGSNANCILIDPTNTQVLYTTTGGYGPNAIKKSTNGGASWTTLTSGLPAAGTSRTQLAMAPSNSSILYASITNGSGYGLLGLYRTTSAGATWTLQNSTTNYLGSQGWYDNAITVHSTNPDIVVVGGLDVYTSSNAGVTLTKRTDWATTSSTNMSHADVHFLGYRGSELYCGSDGGVYKSTNDGVAWSDLNATLSTLQYQSADYDPTNPSKLYGGTQDNNLETSTDGGVTWIQRTTGDGGYSIVDPVNTNFVYGQYVGGSLKRSANSGVTFAEIRPNASTGGLFYNPYEMAPGDHNTIVFGRADLWKATSVQSATTASGWTQIATSATIGGSISAIGISYTDINKIYIGTSGGKLMVTTNNGGSWTTTFGFPYVSDFAVDPGDDNICYATFTGFTSTTHIYKTSNGGSSWFNITNNLPNIPVNTLVVVPASPRSLFVGTDLGVYNSTDDGNTWGSFNPGLPTVAVFDLKYHNGPQILLAATHGRGCWMFDMSTGLPIQLASLTATAIENSCVRIDWTTLTETNNYGFEVQKSARPQAGYQTIPNSFTPGHGTTLEPHSYTYTDGGAVAGHWYYRLKQIDLDGTVHYTDGVGVDVVTSIAERALPTDFALAQNYPNPFNPETVIKFSVPSGRDLAGGGQVQSSTLVEVRVFDVIGREVVTLVNEVKQPGLYEIAWDAGNMPSGIYYYRMKTGGFSDTKKAILLR
ncbi:MAG: hypothetical protein HW412_1497 [Bacteroidetes bacterium]|nr:hypothetical protein [Bacteroidota bacterium]